jgi:hypothetical protein
MLNWEEIANRIEKPILCTQNEVQDLKDFCEKFPYSQVFPLLYLKVLSEGNYVHFEEELEKYAHKITDRVQLYNLLYEKDKDILIPISEVDAEILEEEFHEEKIEDEEVLYSDVKVESQVEVAEIKQVDLEEKLEDQFEEEVIIQIEHAETIVDELEKEILASSASAAFVLEEIEDSSSEPELPEFDLSIGDADDDAEMELEVLPVLTINQNNSSEKTFLEWLSNSTNSNLIDRIENIEIPYEVSYIEFEKPKKEFFSPIKKAKESLSEETLPISETLAKIYHAQGNISKAIDVYQKLSLIIPEKKSYFASQIKSLKKKIN